MPQFTCPRPNSAYRDKIMNGLMQTNILLGAVTDNDFNTHFDLHFISSMQLKSWFTENKFHDYLTHKYITNFLFLGCLFSTRSQFTWKEVTSQVDIWYFGFITIAVSHFLFSLPPDHRIILFCLVEDPCNYNTNIAFNNDSCMEIWKREVWQFCNIQ